MSVPPPEAPATTTRKGLPAGCARAPEVLAMTKASVATLQKRRPMGTDTMEVFMSVSCLWFCGSVGRSFASS